MVDHVPTLTAVDWSKANISGRAKELLTAPGNEHKTHRVIAIPRKVFDRYHPKTWAQCEAAGAESADGVALWITGQSEHAPSGYAYMREGKAHERLVAGLPCLYSQGW